MTDPIARFAEWLAAATATEPNDPTACALATIATRPDGTIEPDVRIVLMKAFDSRGFVFYTNLESAKGRQLAAHPSAALAFHWKSQRRQVRIRGPVSGVSDAEADAYFATRPRASQISAWASRQSQPLAERAIFEAALAQVAQRFPDAVPRPPFWSGLRLAPREIEFWEDREGRQHHRDVATALDAGWTWSLRYP